MSCCCRFRPLENARPAIGSVDVLEEVDEEKIEVVVVEEHLSAVLTAVREAHPYEEPVIQVFPMLDYKSIIASQCSDGSSQSAVPAIVDAVGSNGYAVNVYAPSESAHVVRSALAQAKAGNAQLSLRPPA